LREANTPSTSEFGLPTPAAQGVLNHQYLADGAIEAGTFGLKNS
jgi:hypothetical protein